MKWDAKTSQAQREAVARYDREMTVRVPLKLNRRTDEDILEFLATQENRQGLIKRLLREEMARLSGKSEQNCVFVQL